MNHFPFIKQHDAMECGVACLAMVCNFFRIEYSIEYLSRICFATTEGVSLLGINETALQLGLRTISGRISINKLWEAHYPCILHWNQNHFVVLYKVKKGKTFYIADPAKGLVKYNLEEFKKHWISTHSGGEEKGIAMFLEPTPAFYEKQTDEQPTEERSFKFLFGYIKQYRKYFGQIVLGLLVGSLLQLILPFLTQSIVDVGIKNQNIGFIWLILLGQLMLTISRTAIDFIRRWLLLHISLRINISLVSDFFIKLLKLPMSFFDTKLMGDLMQRMGDHNRVNSFLTQQTLSIVFSLFTFVVFSIVLLSYNWLVFAIFMLGSLLYGGWLALFLRRRKVLDYELFEQQAINNNKTYEFITSMQEIKLQDCEQRRRWEWEDVQADLFNVQMKSLKLQQTQEAGSIFINEIKNRKRKDDHHQIAVGLLQGIGRRNLHRRHRSQPVQPKIDKERLAEAARIANINDYIMRLPLKYNTLIGQDGVGLSQGQKQRILIARAVYKNPQYIFLDEATNALDANNERIIVENLTEFYKGKTVIVVAHRLSTVKNADRIVVIDKGKIIEAGKHQELIASRGAYYNLVKNQLELGS